MRRPGVRISAGELKGVRLEVPSGVRPTGQRVREALFSRWQSRLPGAAVLDLFAGSGAVGLEAVSRGADSVLCVDIDKAVHRELVKATDRLAPEVAGARRASLPEELRRVASGRVFDLVFADPPYAFTGWQELLEALEDLCHPAGEAVMEHSSRVELPSETGGLERRSTRRYGDSCLSFYGVKHRPG